MQETFYQISVSLKDTDLTQKRLELLKKVDFLGNKLKTHGHAGRYGLKGLYCFAPDINEATCIASTEHEDGFPWLQDTITEIKKEEDRKLLKQKEFINDAIKGFNKFEEAKDKQKYLNEEVKWDKIGVSKKDVTVKTFVGELNRRKIPIYSAKDFEIDEVFIEPLKPSKKELANEENYANALTEKERISLNLKLFRKHGTRREWVSWTEIMDGKTRRAKRLRENFDDL
jgi:hypothetical protein